MALVLNNILEVPSFRGTFYGDRDGVLDYLNVIGNDHSTRRAQSPNDVKFQDHELPECASRKGGAVHELVTEICNNLGGLLECREVGWWEPWVIINKPGEQVFPHNHNVGANEWSCVYWADVPKGSGNLEFYPFGLQSGDYPVMMTEAQQGDYLIFPGWILHGVRQNCSKQNRVSMSINLRAEYDNKPTAVQPFPNSNIPIGIE